MPKRVALPLLIVGVLVAAVIVFRPSREDGSRPGGDLPYQPVSSKGTDRPAKEFEITSKTANVELAPGKRTEAWTYNGSVPGPELRVEQGELLRVTYKNELPEQSTIHWHGLNDVDNSNDGVAGVTQNAVRPGETYVYEFVPPRPGTYWYHSHQNATEQVDRGLGGFLIVEPREPTDDVDREVNLMLDEYVLDERGGIQGGEDARHGPGAARMMNTDPDSDVSDIEFAGYNTFTINGKTSPDVPPIDLKPGEKVRLRIVNAGNQNHTLHLHGHRYRLTAADAAPVNEPELTEDAFTVIPGERVDVEFTAENPGAWRLHAHDPDPALDLGDQARPTRSEQMSVLIRYPGFPNRPTQNDLQIPEDPKPLDLLSYGEPAEGLGLTDQTAFDRSYELKIEMTIDTDEAGGGPDGDGMSGMEDMDDDSRAMEGMEMGFTVNGKAFPETDALPVKEGERVRLEFVNESPVAHPMHLHGQEFQVLSVEGRAPTGSPLVKDLVDVRPNQRVVVGFVTDNPGLWMLHCHILPHASGGLTVPVPYEGYVQPFEPDETEGFNIGE